MDTLDIPRARTGTIRNKAKPSGPSMKLLPAQQDQANKLHVKSQMDLELLDEVRSYMKLRANIETEYAIALQKITQQALMKRKWNTPKLPASDGNEYRLSVTAWKALLDDTLEMAKARAGIAEKLNIMIIDPSKNHQKQKQTILKKGMEHCNVLGEEIAKTCDKLEKAKKVYVDLEKVAAVARDKFNEIDSRGKKKGGLKLFETKADLDKKLEKAKVKKDLCERRAQSARHDLILCFAQTNAHHAQYYRRDLPELMAYLDGDYYNQLRSYFTAYAAIIQEASVEEQSNCQDIKKEAVLIDRDFEARVFVLEHPQEFTEPPPLEFKPLETDKYSIMIVDDGSRPTLHKEMQKMVNHVAKCDKIIEQKRKELQSVQSMLDVYQKQPQFGNAEAQSEAELTVEKTKDLIRQMELQKIKAQARIDVMVAAGFRLEEFKPVIEDDLPDGTPAPLKAMSRRSSIASMTSAIQTSKGQRCRAIYDYKAQASDELTILEDEILTIIENDQDGWMKGENARGEIGIFPTSYVEIMGDDDDFDDDDNSSLPSISSLNSGISNAAANSKSITSINVPNHSSNYLPAQQIFASPPTTSNNNGYNSSNNTASMRPSSSASNLSSAAAAAAAAAHHPVSAASYASNPAPSAYQSPAHVPVHVHAPVQAPAPAPAPAPVAAAKKPVKYLRQVQAAYDFEDPEEGDLPFSAGDIINVIEERDDEYWVGELNGVTGTFPSMLVEELDGESSL